MIEDGHCTHDGHEAKEEAGVGQNDLPVGEFFSGKQTEAVALRLPP